MVYQLTVPKVRSIFKRNIDTEKINFPHNSLSEFSAAVLQILDRSGVTTWNDLLADTYWVAGTVIGAANGVSLMPNFTQDDWYYAFRAGVNDQTNHVRIGWLQNAAQPYFGIGRDDTTVTTNAIIDALRLRMGCGTNNSAPGQGLGIPIYLGNDAAELEVRAGLYWYLADASNGSEVVLASFVVYSGATPKTPLLLSPLGITVTGLTAATSIWWHEYLLSSTAFSQGASGATQVSPDANTLGGWVLDRDDQDEIIFAVSHIEDDWDGASDPIAEVYFEVNVDNTGGLVTDTVDLKMIYRYKGNGESAIKTQTIEVATVVGQSARYKQFKVEFPLDWDLANNVLQVADVISLGISLETDTSEVDNIIINFAEFKYHTAKPAPEV